MNLAMDLAALCDIKRCKWYQWMPFGCFSQDIAYVHHFVATHRPPPSQTIGFLVVLATPVKYLQWWEVQLAIQSMVGE